MTTIKASGGRMIAPIDQVLDPARGSLGAGGFLRPAGGRARATSLPLTRPSAGDFGALLHYHADDATADAWPCRTAVSATLTPWVGEVRPSISSAVEAFAGLPCVVFTDGDAACMRSPDLSHLFTSIGLGSFEVVIVCAVTNAAPASQRRIFGTLDDEGSPSAGHVSATLTPSGSAAWVRTTATPDGRRSCALPANDLRVLHFVVRRADTRTDADLYVNGIGSDYAFTSSTDAQAWDLSRISVGGDSAGSMGAAGIAIREIAVYDRELTRAERVSIWQGYTAPNYAVPPVPRLSDVIDLAGAVFYDFDASGTCEQVAGVLESVEGWTRTAGTSAAFAVGRGRRVVNWGGAPGTFDSGAPVITVASGSPWCAGVAWRSLATSRQAVNAYGTTAGDDVGSALTTGNLRGTYNGTTLEIATSATGAFAFAHLDHDGFSDAFLRGAVWGSDDPTLALGQAMAAIVPRATLAIDPRIGAGVGGGDPLTGSPRFVLGAYVCDRLLSVEEIRTVFRFYMAERTPSI